MQVVEGRAVLARDAFFFFFNDTATTEIYPLSLHDPLPIWSARGQGSRGDRCRRGRPGGARRPEGRRGPPGDRKRPRLNSSHSQISNAGFCLKKKKRRPSQYTTSSDQLYALSAHHVPCQPPA